MLRSTPFQAKRLLAAKTGQQHPPTCSSPAASPLRCTIQCLRQLSVDCCVFLVKWRPPKTKTPPSLSFLMGANSAPQTSQMMLASVSLMARNLCTPVWEQGHDYLWAALPCPWRERGQSYWRVGRQRLMLVVVCGFVGLCLAVEYLTLPFL